MKKRTSPFGAYLRTKRVAAELSLREVASRLGVSHVYLSEVERGERGPIKRERWPALVASIPGVDESDLVRHAELTEGVQLNLSDAPPRYQELGLMLARRVADRDLDDDELERLLRMLGGRREHD